MNVENNKNSIFESFKAHIKEQSFPCVGAKSALAHAQIESYITHDMRCPAFDGQIANAIAEFAARCNKDSLFVSFVVIFEGTPDLTEEEFEQYLWQRLQGVHNADVKRFAWDKNVSSDPESSDFSMSVGGKGFYIVGLHPNSSRPARRFKTAALVFNLHSQFELLRDKGAYTRIKEKILERDKEFNGSINPMLAVHGESSEARQYSGRITEDEWKCPFRPQQ